jgi:hypothetical protein
MLVVAARAPATRRANVREVTIVTEVLDGRVELRPEPDQPGRSRGVTVT